MQFCDVNLISPKKDRDLCWSFHNEKSVMPKGICSNDRHQD